MIWAYQYTIQLAVGLGGLETYRGMIPCGMMRLWRSLSANACRTWMCPRAVFWCPFSTARTGRNIGVSESRIHHTWRHGAVKSSFLSLSCRCQSSRMASPEPNHTGPSFWLLEVLPPVPPSRNASLRTSLTRILSSVFLVVQAGGCAHPSWWTSHHVSAIHQGSEYQVPQDVHPQHMSMRDYVWRTLCLNWTHTIPISIVIPPNSMAKAHSTCMKNGQFCARDIICWVSLVVCPRQAFSPRSFMNDDYHSLQPCSFGYFLPHSWEGPFLQRCFCKCFRSLVRTRLVFPVVLELASWLGPAAIPMSWSGVLRCGHLLRDRTRLCRAINHSLLSI